MLKFISLERFNQPIFPQNFLISIDSIELERPDKISLQQFTKVEQELMFLIYPAVRLQNCFRIEFGGKDMWNNIYKRLLADELEEEQKIQAQYLGDEIRKMKAKRSEKKMEEFEQFIRQKKLTMKFESETKNLPVREARRRGSDSRMNAKLKPLIEEPPRRIRSVVYIKKDLDWNDKIKAAREAKKDQGEIPQFVRIVRETKKTRTGIKKNSVHQSKTGRFFTSYGG